MNSSTESLGSRTIIANLMLVFVVICFLPSSAAAKFNKQDRSELEGYLAKFEANTDVDAKVAWILTKGLLVSKKERDILEAFKTNDDETIRLAAGIALWRAGDRDAESFVKTEFTAYGSRYNALRSFIATLENKTERKLLDALIEKAKPEVTRDVFRYAIELDAHRGLVTDALDSKNEGTRKLAWEAIGAADPATALKIVDSKRSDKREPERMAALNIAIAWVDSVKWNAKALTAVGKFAKSDASQAIKERAARVLVENNVSGGGNILFDATAEEARASALKFIVNHDGSVAKSKLTPLLKSKDQETKRYAYMLAAKSDKSLAKQLDEMYRSVEFPDRIIGVSAIGYTKSKQAEQVLTTAIFEGDDKIRKAAVLGLAALSKESTLPSLDKALKAERNDDIKLLLVDTIGSIKSKKALYILRFQVTARDATYKRRVVDAIRNIGISDGAKALNVLIRDRNIETRWTAFLAMASLDSAEAVKHYDSVFRNPPTGYLEDVDALDPGVRKTIYAYLLKKGGASAKASVVARGLKNHEFLDTIYKMVDSGELPTPLRQRVAYHQFRFDKKARPVLERLVKRTISSPLAVSTLWFLVRAPSKNDEPTFRGLLSHKDKSVATIGMYGLAQIKK